MSEQDDSDFRDPDERVSLAPLDPEEALRALLAVKPDDETSDTSQGEEEPEESTPNE